MIRTHLALLTVACLALGACGGGNAKPSPSPQPTNSTAQTSPDPTVALREAVRIAVRDNNRLAGYVLWHNTIPSWANQSTRGPALTGLRQSTIDARKARLRVRTLSDSYEIVDLELDPSYTRATATVRQRSRIRVYRKQRRSNRTRTVNETARLELRRLGREERFVVWEVRVL